MSLQSLTGPENQKVTFIELFFDLVFVFAVTQVVGLFHDGITWASVGQAVLVFWLVWWAWTQFTWTLNAADTTHYVIEFGTLLATVAAFFMAVALPDAYHGRELWFAVPYVLVRVIGLTLYALVASASPTQRVAVRTFSMVSAGGMVAVIIGASLGGPSQYWFWGFAILLDVIAAEVGAQAEGWDLHTEHFVERHGLFVIIALGETLIVTAGGVSGVDWNGNLIAVAVLGVAIIFGFWWSYFPDAKPGLEHALSQQTGSRHSEMARDVFSLLHFPMICGIVALAVALEEAIGRPGDALGLEGRLALAAGLFLFVGGMALAALRAKGKLLLMRVLCIAVTAAAVIAITGVVPAVTLAVAFTGLVVTIVAERLTVKSHIVEPSLDIENLEQ